MKEILTAVFLMAAGIGVLVLSARSFREKGFLFNNAFLYASKQERDSMDKKPLYWQSAIVFLLSGIALLLCVAWMIMGSRWVFYIMIGISAATIVYAVASSIRSAIKGEA